MHTLLKRHLGLSRSTNWYCLNDGEKIIVIPEEVPDQSNDVKHEPNTELIDTVIDIQGELEVGRTVTTAEGIVGTLICSSQMGFDPLDVFNDMMVEEEDLKHFLGANNFTDTDRAALSIKAYLKLCHMTSRSTWKPSEYLYDHSEDDSEEQAVAIYDQSFNDNDTFEATFEEAENENQENNEPKSEDQENSDPLPKKKSKEKSTPKIKRQRKTAPATPTHFTVQQIQG